VATNEQASETEAKKKRKCLSKNLDDNQNKKKKMLTELVSRHLAIQCDPALSPHEPFSVQIPK
jgi:hypothetical protein